HPRRIALRARLWAVRHGFPLPPLPPAGAKTFDLLNYSGVPALEDFCHALGYRRITRKDGSALAVRADVLERLARDAYRLATAKPQAPQPDLAEDSAAVAPPKGFAAGPALRALADCGATDLEAMLFALGYRRHGEIDGEPRFLRKGTQR